MCIAASTGRDDQRKITAGEVCLVIPSYRRPDLIARALEALLGAGQRPGHVIVVEDSDQVEEVAAVVAMHSDVTLTSNGRNEGFAASASRGIAEAIANARGFAVVGLLNSDVLVEDGWLPPLLAELANADYVVPRMVTALGDFVDGDGDLLTRGGAGRRIHRNMPVSRSVAHRHMVLYPTGGACLVRREVWQVVGLFDCRLHMYYEDVDWGLRALAQGYRGHCVTTSVVRHEGHATAGRSMAVAASYRNFLRVAVSRLPRGYYRASAPWFFRAVVTGFLHTSRVTSPLAAATSVGVVLGELPRLFVRRRELSWREKDVLYLLRLMRAP